MSGYERSGPPVLLIVAMLATALGAVFLPTNLFEHLDAQEIMVVQAPWSGKLAVHTDQGVKWQGFGKVTKYHKRDNFTFEKEGDDKDADPIKIRFAEGGHAFISGTISWEPPSDANRIIALHAKYGNQAALEKALVAPVVVKAIYMTGPLMSSKESSSSRRNELISFVEDQIQNGVYRTQVVQTKIEDQITGKPQTVDVVKLISDKEGKWARQESSPLNEFGVRVWNFSPKNVEYDAVVEKQIQEQQQATMQVQTAMANALKAEQDAKTAAKNGEAEAAKAKWAQEAIKATAVTQAEQQRDVARLDRETAEQEKAAAILRAQGEAEGRRLVMQADNALAARLDATVKINQAYAEALAEMKVPVVPGVVMGGASGTGSSGGIERLIELLTANAAKQIANTAAAGQ